MPLRICNVKLFSTVKISDKFISGRALSSFPIQGSEEYYANNVIRLTWICFR